ncbi:LuxR C-terminal-related transcriptional regulator [Nitrosomonas marina]|nr:LuxR C-terminal-related transcriptional regulator [Nitrosomonas marina]
MSTGIPQHRVLLITKKSVQVDFLIKFFNSKKIACTQREAWDVEKPVLNASTILMIDFLVNNPELIDQHMSRLNKKLSRLPIFGLFNIDQKYNTGKLIKLTRWENFRFCFLNTISEKQLLSGISTVAQGDYWLPRELLNAVLKKIHHSNNMSPKQQLINLTKKEKVILNLISEGYSNTRIANSQFVTIHTVKRHVYNIFRKINVSNRVQAVQWFNSIDQR